MGLFDKTIVGAIIGFGVGTFGKSALTSAGSVVRPLAKGLIAAGLAASSQAKILAAEAMEQMNDLVAEVESESPGAKPRKASHAKSGETNSQRSADD